MSPLVLAAAFNLNHPAHTRGMAFHPLSVANVMVIGVMLVVFAPRYAAVPGSRSSRRRAQGRGPPSEHHPHPAVRGPPQAVLDGARPRSRRGGAASRQAAARRAAHLRGLLDLRVRRGLDRLAGRHHRLGHDPGVKGPAWWHYTGIGHFFNAIHLWSVELFFFAMVVHLWGKYWMAAWRGGRERVWVTGAITFLVAVPARSPGMSPSRTSTRSGSPRRPRTR